MLREARERRGLSLRQIANSTKIAMMTLEALERNDIARLPGGIFSRAFVRAYALEVGLDAEVVIEAFMSQFPQDSVTVGHPTSSQVEDHEAVESDRRTATTFLRLLAVSIPIAAVVVYFGTAGRRAAVDSPPSREALPRGLAEARQGLARAEAGPQEAVETPAAPATVKAAPVPPAAPVPADRLIVQVLAVRRAWISAIVDGSRAAQREFMPGEEQTFEVRSEIVLTSGDAGGVAVTFNGMPARPLGGDGKVVTLRVNPTNFKTYLVTP